MKLAAAVLFAVLVVSPAARAQFKSQADQEPTVAPSLVRPMTSMNSFLGLINPDNFMMRHTLSYSFLSAGGQSLSIASYTNSMFYKIADPLNVRVDLTVQGTPSGATPFQSALNGVFLSRAEMNYHPWQNMFIKLEYNRLPASYWGPGNLWYRPSPFGGWGDE